MRDDDRMLDLPNAEFGSGIVGVCDVCGQRQAVVILQKERFRLCVIDFLNKSWIKSDRRPTAPAPLYRSERVWYPTASVPGGRAPAVVLSPTKTVRHPVVLVVPEVYGITTTLLDAAIRFAKEGFEVLVPDLAKTEGVGVGLHASLHGGRLFRGGVPVASTKVAALLGVYRDALRALLAREMVDPSRCALFGASYGGSLALALAAESTGVSAVALAYPMPVRPATLPSLVTAPILLVRGSRDAAASTAERQLRAAGAEGRLRVATLDGGRHGFLSRDLGAYDLTLAEHAWEEILGFLKAQLMPPPPKPAPPPIRQAAVAVTPESSAAKGPSASPA
ncbi:MAG TPA: alpha/beta family hydrolase [Thermoplasmata archaeon]|nr:alpha/beta family hydrolase [Thermoplasmata archaeon]